MHREYARRIGSRDEGGVRGTRTKRGRDRLDAQQRGERCLVPARRQGGGGPRAVRLRTGDEELHGRAKKAGPGLALSSRPATPPSIAASRGGPVRDTASGALPSGFTIRPEKCTTPPASRAWPAIGVLHDPSSTARNARSHARAIAASASLIASTSARLWSSSALASIAMTPCPTA